MFWKRVILSWMTLLALVFASASAAAAADVSPKTHVGAIDLAAAICIEAQCLTSTEEYLENPRLSTADTSDVPHVARGVPAGAKAFHHTVEGAVESISRTGLRPGSYATPTSGLSPLQAHIELALNPAGGARNAVLQIDLGGLRAAGYEIPSATRVTGQFGMAGGGFEMRFPYAVPPEFIKVLTP